MNKWIHRQKFSYKKPIGIPHKFDVTLQEKVDGLSRRINDKFQILKPASSS
ncbi:protein of unknown function [Xenorhabdus bovienii]|uniref:Transposase n=1 Tax=Xenorhabdus bovienii TaxID=40576 RepID=A0A0B6XGL5_XENBV|nr:protein of unknown function [Xenorhabdus bovienii]